MLLLLFYLCFFFISSFVLLHFLRIFPLSGGIKMTNFFTQGKTRTLYTMKVQCVLLLRRCLRQHIIVGPVHVGKELHTPTVWLIHYFPLSGYRVERGGGWLNLLEVANIILSHCHRSCFFSFRPYLNSLLFTIPCRHTLIVSFCTSSVLNEIQFSHQPKNNILIYSNK